MKMVIAILISNIEIIMWKHDDLVALSIVLKFSDVTYCYFILFYFIFFFTLQYEIFEYKRFINNNSEYEIWYIWNYSSFYPNLK